MWFVWLQPLAWLGLVTLVVPILIHLLVRHRSRRLLFPSLRFLRSTTIVALRRQFISSWPLLIIRLMALAAAVAALAGPTFVTTARQEAWSKRLVRAILDGPGSGAPKEMQAAKDPIVEEERASTFMSAVFAGNNLAGAVRDAVTWLNGLPPAAREIVVVGDLRQGSLTQRHIDSIPRHIGIRFRARPVAPDTSPIELIAVGDRSGGTPTVSRIRVSLAENRTSGSYEPDAAVNVPIEVRAAREHEQHAQALLRAVLAEGVVFGRENGRPVTVVFAGEATIERLRRPASQRWMREALERLPDLSGGEAEGRLVIRANVPAASPSAPALVARILRAVFAEDRSHLEPRRIASTTLEAWSRAPSPSLAPVPPADEGDRRWFWALALTLLAIEHFVRGGRRPDRSNTASSRGREEVRVA